MDTTGYDKQVYKTGEMSYTPGLRVWPDGVRQTARNFEEKKMHKHFYTTPSGIDIKVRVTGDGTIEHTRVDNECYHREDGGPAIVYKNGWKEWRINGMFHREGDLPAVERPEGDVEYWVHGQRHRAEGPAQVVHGGCTPDELAAGKKGIVFLQRWFVDNRQAREDGPANIYFDVDKNETIEDYWLDGVQVPEMVVMNPEALEGKKVLSEENVEVRRIMIERMGVAKFLEEVGAVAVDKDDGIDGPRALFKTTGSDITVGHRGFGSAVAFLACSCPSTGRMYFMQVPATSETCYAANEWLSGELAGSGGNQVGRT